jgi:hypothetical protein
VVCAGGALSSAQLTAGTTITRPAVTKHLGGWAVAGGVHDLRLGRGRLWEFTPARLDEARQALDAISAQWGEALVRLQRFVES